MKTISYLYDAGSGITLDCELEYDPGEDANTDPESPTCGPGCAPAAWLITAKIGDLDIMPVLDQTIIELIEVAACQSEL